MTIEILTRGGKKTVPAVFIGARWAVNGENRNFTVTHIPTGRAFCTHYESAKLAKTVAKELESLLPFDSEEDMQEPCKALRDGCRALWSLSTIRDYGEAYNAVSKLYPNV